MKHFIKMVSGLFFAVMLYGCLPHEKLTGRVIDVTGPVPEAAVLGMLWVEDADKAMPKPDVKNLKSEDLDAALEKDMKDRGLPVAYSRAFSDKNGEFTLDKLHFSAETKKVVRAMKQPRITRITLNAFQRGYLKHAATVFPKSEAAELSPATVILSRPESWKQLALDSSYVTLRRNEYDAGYSKEFGATKKEKEWFLEYTSSNLNKAYAESNIKGDKIWEEDCGHDYNDIIISTAGMQRNPAREKCNRLLHQMGVLREWKKEWLDHSLAITEKPEPAVSAIKAALEVLGPEYAEVKANEGYIIAGVDEAENQQRKNQANQNLRNGLNDNNTGTEEARRLYNTGDKAGAYKALGGVLYLQMPAEARQGSLTAQLIMKTAPGIADAVSGFYLLMNKPLTAQLPNGDGGNHKDKPGYKVEATTETAGKESNVKTPNITKEAATARRIKLGDDEIDVEKVRAKYYVGEDIGSEKHREIFEGRETERSISKKVYGQPNADYFVKVENHIIIPVCEDCEDYEVKEKLQLYSADGAMLLNKDFNNVAILRVNIIKNGVFLVDLEPRETGVSRKQEIYNAKGELLYESQNITDFLPSPQANYLLFIEKAGDGIKIGRVDLNGNVRILAELQENLSGIQISDDGTGFVIAGGAEIEKTNFSGWKYWQKKIFFFKNFKLIWNITLEKESFPGIYLSKSAKYIIVCHDTVKCKNVVSEEGDALRSCINDMEKFIVINATTQKTVYDGLKNEKLILEYMNETMKN